MKIAIRQKKTRENSEIIRQEKWTSQGQDLMQENNVEIRGKEKEKNPSTTIAVKSNKRTGRGFGTEK